MTYAPTDAEIEALADRLRSDLGNIVGSTSLRWILERYEPRSNEQRCDGSGRLWYRDNNRINISNVDSCPGCRACQPKATPITCLSHNPHGYCETCGSDNPPPKATPKSDAQAKLYNCPFCDLSNVACWAMGPVSKCCQDCMHLRPKPTPATSVSEVMTGSEGERNAYVAGYAAGRDDATELYRSDGSPTSDGGSKAEGQWAASGAAGAGGAKRPDLTNPSAAPVTVELGPVTLRALYELLYEIGMLSDTQRMRLRDELEKKL